ncbi:restriction endonuclease subunit S [Haemophilus sp. CCUG 60358]|uniref:restriction endonuclease subunit S n=1 Tax=Haemophilus sp. CCUG 60358 TaxID=1859695 RepID=UPI000802F918|nr:restriction endonuclease subunit S [Haemophilus sp. CCUG 60358]OBX89153.1 restriction endonuclease subunit S [Haemophilus sp. CCUG 60358]
MKNNRTFLEKLLDGAEVEWKPLKDILIRTKGTKITAAEMKILHKDNAPLKIFAGGKTFALVNFEDIPEKDINKNPSIIVKSRGIIEFEYYDKPFSHKNEMWSYYSNDKNINIKYIYYVLKNQEPYFQNLGSKMQMPQIATPDTDKYLVPIPPLSVQTEIVKILDALTALTSELTSELILRRKQYEYYREKLLSFDSLEQLNMGGAKKKLIDVAIYAKVRILADKLDKENYVGVENLLQNKLGKTSSNYVPTDGAFIEYLPNDILIGNIRPYLRKIWLSDRKGGTNGDVLVIRLTDENILPRYLYHILANEHFFEYNVKYSKGAKMPRGDKAAILQYEFDVPPLEEQQHIVSILDKFETLTNSITEGLPLAIEQSQKRYEYYRELLLSFSGSNQ